MKKSINQLNRIKTLVITKFEKNKHTTEQKENFKIDIEKIMLSKNTSSAFRKLTYIALQEHQKRIAELKWSFIEIETSLVELSIEIDNI